MAEGAEKYGTNNWEKGFPVSDILNHALSHIYSFLAGDQSEDHLGHAAANLLMAIDTEAKK
jgi:arginyl-tRNA--protein-N-Asp/Glu arginylyltransferase